MWVWDDDSEAARFINHGVSVMVAETLELSAKDGSDLHETISNSEK